MTEARNLRARINANTRASVTGPLGALKSSAGLGDDNDSSGEQEQVKTAQPRDSEKDTTEEDTGPLIFVPCRPYEKVGQKPVAVEFEVRELASGTGALPVFTSEERLAAVLGKNQASIAVPILSLLKQIAGKVPVVVDPV